MTGGIDQDILGLYVAVADFLRVEVTKGAERLVSVEPYELQRDLLVELLEVPHHSIYSVWYIIHNDVEINFRVFFPLEEESMS